MILHAPDHSVSLQFPDGSLLTVEHGERKVLGPIQIDDETRTRWEAAGVTIIDEEVPAPPIEQPKAEPLIHLYENQTDL